MAESIANLKRNQVARRLCRNVHPTFSRESLHVLALLFEAFLCLTMDLVINTGVPSSSTSSAPSPRTSSCEVTKALCHLTSPPGCPARSNAYAMQQSSSYTRRETWNHIHSNTVWESRDQTASETIPTGTGVRSNVMTQYTGQDLESI